MARSSTTIELIRRTGGDRYNWPDFAINIWVIIILATAGTLIGVFATFLVDQAHFQAPTPWLFPFGIVVGVLTFIYVVFVLVLIQRATLLPFLVIVFTTILFSLYLTGLIETAIQLFRAGGVNSSCQTYVLGQPVYGQTINTLAWLEQNSICQAWYAVFSFWIVGAIFFVWMFVIAVTVARNSRDYD